MATIPSNGLHEGREITVDIVIPVLNEAHVLERSVATVRKFLGTQSGYRLRVVIVDNGSTDSTSKVGETLAKQYTDVQFIHLDQKGRGRALQHAWIESTADIACYMDVDLSTELEALPKALRAIAENGYDIAIGSRLLPESNIRRSPTREFISRVYNLLVRVVLCTRFSDAQCGFKAVSRQVIERIVGQVRDESWFFDTELLVLAEKMGYRIFEIPVVWNEDGDSRVKLLRTAWEDICGIFRLRWMLWTGRFRAVAARSCKQADATSEVSVHSHEEVVSDSISGIMTSPRAERVSVSQARAAKGAGD